MAESEIYLPGPISREIAQPAKGNYRTVQVAKTGKPYDQELFDKVIALRNQTYNNAPELEKPDAIKLRLSGENLENDPVSLEINAIVDDQNAVKGFSIVESYLGKGNMPVRGCMTYANADPEFARGPGGMEALMALHKESVAGRDYPIIVEVNPGDEAVIDGAKNKHLHPFDLRNNDDPLVVEMAIKLGVDPKKIPVQLIEPLKWQAKGEQIPPDILKEMIRMGQLKDVDGKIITAIVPAPYNALNLGIDADPANPFEGGPENLHMAIVNLPGGVDFTQVEEGYCGLNESILAGNGETPRSTDESRAMLEAQAPHEHLHEAMAPYRETRDAINTLHELHKDMQEREALVGAKGNGFSKGI